MALDYFTKLKNHYKSIITLGLPIVLGQLGIIIVGFADNIMVGQYNTLDLAAASFVNNIFNLPVLFGLGFSYGLTPIVGQLFGQNKHFKIGEVLKNSLIANFIIGVVLTIIMIIFYMNVENLRQETELIPLIKPYFVLQIISIIFLMLFNSFKQLSDGITNTKTPMYIMLCANIINIIGNYILIYGKLGLPEMGVVGAGISTLFSRIFMLIALASMVFKHKQYRIVQDGLKEGFINRKDIFKLSNMGLMIGIQMGLETGLFSISSIMVGWLGSIALASHQIVVTMSTLGFMVYYGIGAATSVKVSLYYGRQDYSNIKNTVKAGLHITAICACIASTLFLLFHDTIGYIFNDNAQVIATVSSLMLIMVAYQVGDTIQVTYANALRGLSDVKSMMIISFIGYILLALPICYIGGFVLNLGIQGIWLGYPVGLTSTGIMLAYRFFKVLRIKEKSKKVQ